MSAVIVRSPLKMEMDRARVATMYLQGFTQAQIAQELGLTTAQVYHDIKVVRHMWLEQSLEAMTEIKAKELARIDEVEKEAWEAWRESKKEFLSSTVKIEAAVVRDPITGGSLENPQVSTKQTKREKRTGASEYLNIIQWCIEQRLKLFGAYASPKLQIEDLDGMIEKEIHRLAKLDQPKEPKQIN